MVGWGFGMNSMNHWRRPALCLQSWLLVYSPPNTRVIRYSKWSCCWRRELSRCQVLTFISKKSVDSRRNYAAFVLSYASYINCCPKVENDKKVIDMWPDLKSLQPYVSSIWEEKEQETLTWMLTSAMPHDSHDFAGYHVYYLHLGGSSFENGFHLRKWTILKVIAR